jgi:hypothetical protein
MSERWEDYYKILQVYPSAELDIIEAAYRRLARKYHPDVNKDPSAEERMKKINTAYEILSNPDKRRQYDPEWFQKTGMGRTSTLPKPKPVVNPEYFYFKELEPKEIQTASFIISNTGGPYTKIWISNPNSWIKIVNCSSLTDYDELPLQVKIEVEGDDWDKNYSEIIKIRLDEEETQVRVTLQTKSMPTEKIKTEAKSNSKTTHVPYSSSPVSPKHRILTWAKWTVALIVSGLIITTISQFCSLEKPASEKPLSVSIPNVSILKTTQIEESLKEWQQKNGQNSYYDSYYFVYVGEYVWATVGRYYTTGLVRIIHSVDNGNNWEIQWEDQQTRMSGICFFNKAVGIVATNKILLKTSDGGKTWNDFLSLNNMPGVCLWRIKSIAVKDEQHITVEVSGGVNENIKTSDGGKTWELISYHGRYYGSETGTLRTSNGGETWQAINIRYK